VLLFYSDGLMERQAADGHMTGFEDFREMASAIAADREVDEIAEAVLNGAERMGAVRDDVTLVVLKVAA
jgi:serine phosphatase RsbU (regulator of sigma subunit)